MPVPLPEPSEVLLDPPDGPETRQTARGVASAAALDGRLTDLQRVLLEAVFRSMTGHPVDLGRFDPMSAADFASHLSRRDLQFRSRGVQVMLLAALVLRPLPEAIVNRIVDFAGELGVDEGMVAVARGFADDALGLAAVDFERNGYTASWDSTDAAILHTSNELREAWATSVADDRLAERWRSLELLPLGTLGRSVAQMYLARGFEYPGSPGSAPPLLAQHDWVHVLADFGTTVQSELEVFALIARANDEMHAFSLLAMVVSLFETGYLRAGLGLFQASEGHLSGDLRVVERMADAMRRGAQSRDGQRESDSIDYLRVDWFELADRPVEEVRRLFGITAKSSSALDAGSVGLWEPGGISPFQLSAGRTMAERRGEFYEPFGAEDARGAVGGAGDR